MGGSDLDLNHVELASDRVELDVYSITGGCDIRVPNGMRVEVPEFAFMDANSVDIADSHPTLCGPVLHLRLFSLMGGTDVMRGPKVPRRERKALHQRRES